MTLFILIQSITTIFGAMDLPRVLKKVILARLQPNKVVMLNGPRRVGKTILLHQIAAEIGGPVEFLNGEDQPTQEFLSRRAIANYQQAFAGKPYLFIDEAQKVPHIGDALKLIVDTVPGIHILVSGSSTFDMRNKLAEPLTGRSLSFMMYPLSEEEIQPHEKVSERKDKLNSRLVYGNYPEVFSIRELSHKAEYLRELAGATLTRDLLALEDIRNASKINNLLRLIAFQVGQEVSYQELGRQLAMSKNTVERYLDLLSKVYVLYKVEGFSKNLRKEIVKNPRWYFVDNGLMNAILSNFNSIHQREDVGRLWENYILSERIKYQQYHRMVVNNFFWRTYDQQEIDWVEEREGKLHGYEVKWKPQRMKAPAAWSRAYTDATFEVIHQDNYLDWVIRR